MAEIASAEELQNRAEYMLTQMVDDASAKTILLGATVSALTIAAALVAAIDRNTSVLEQVARQLEWIENNTRTRT